MQIVTLNEAGWDWLKIIDHIGKKYGCKVSTRTCQRIVSKYKRTGTVADMPRSGRPEKLTQQEKHIVRRIMLRDRKKTPREAVTELKEYYGVTVCSRTVRRTLTKSGLKRRVAARRPLLTARMRRERLSWARDHENWSIDKWKGVVFSDEKIFRLGNNAGGIFVTRLPTEKYSASCIQSTIKHGLQVHVWGAIGWNGVAVLKLVQGNLKAKTYQDEIINDLPDSGRAVSNRFRSFRFQHDNAPAHTAGSTKGFLTQRGIKPIDWRGNSPDMNPIENVWSVVARAADYHVTNQQQLFRAVIRAWTQVSVSYIRKLFRSMRNRVREVIRNRGGSTHY